MTTPRRQRRSWGKIRKLAHGSGRFQASYMGPDLMRDCAPATYTTRMDAEGWLRDERRLIEHDEWTPPKLRAEAKHQRGKAFQEYATGWLEIRNLKPRTRQGYSELLAGPLASLHKTPLNMLTAEVVRHWHAGLPADTPTKNAHSYGLLHTMMNTAVIDGLITSNPCTIRGAMKAPTQPKAAILTPDEVAKVALAMRPEKLKALVLISAWCGLRWGEVTELRRGDIAPDCSLISVARAVTHCKGQCHVSTPKSGKPRQVYVPPHIQADIREHMDQHVGAAPDALLFTTERACHFSEHTFRASFAEALKSVGREHVRIHDLRHFAGTQAARVGNLVETMARLGHSTVSASWRACWALHVRSSIAASQRRHGASEPTSARSSRRSTMMDRTKPATLSVKVDIPRM